MKSSLGNPGKCNSHNLKRDYYDRGFGVNEAEALRQELIIQLQVPLSGTRNEKSVDRQLTRLAYLAGARMLSGREKCD
jgi:hypothetical protein